MFNVTDEEVDQLLEAIEREQHLDQGSLLLLGDKLGWPFKVSKNQLALISAPTGVGKTSFILECIKAQLRDKRRCLLISNEEGRVTLYRRLLYAYLKGQANELGLSKRDVLKGLASYLKIVDASTYPEVYAYDRIVDLTAELIIKWQPDIVFLDQLSYCKEKHNVTSPDIAMYDALPRITEGFMKLINSSKTPIPPLVLSQQGQSTSANGSSEESLRGAKTTPQAVHKHLNLLRSKTGDIQFQVRKYRGSNPPPDALFRYDKQSQVFIRLDGDKEPPPDDTPDATPPEGDAA